MKYNSIDLKCNTNWFYLYEFEIKSNVRSKFSSNNPTTIDIWIIWRYYCIFIQPRLTIRIDLVVLDGGYEFNIYPGMFFEINKHGIS